MILSYHAFLCFQKALEHLKINFIWQIYLNKHKTLPLQFAPGGFLSEGRWKFRRDMAYSVVLPRQGAFKYFPQRGDGNCAAPGRDAAMEGCNGRQTQSFGGCSLTTLLRKKPVNVSPEHS